MFDVGSGEILMILLAALLLFGGRLPEVARNVGRSVADFKRGLSDAARPLTEARAEVEREVADAGSGSGERGEKQGPGPGRGDAN